MNIFNNDKTKLNSEQNISLEDYERRISERTEEYHRLNEILRGMRVEVSNLMEEIKHLSDEIVKKNAEVFLVDQKLDDLNRDYQLLKQNIVDGQENYLDLVKKIEKLNEENKSNLQIQDKLNQSKIEYNMILNQIAEKKSELEVIQNLISTSFLSDKLEVETTFNEQKVKKVIKRCSAKTKNGVKCKRKAVDNSEFCAIHLKKSSR